jgi:multidrug efflux pump subunit AcrA (membrane-fusion protein)
MNARIYATFVALAIFATTSNAQEERKASVTLYARVTGHLEKVLVKPGNVVKKGELLFELDAALLRAELAQMNAEYEVGEAKLQQLKVEFARAKRLFEAKAISQEEFTRIAGEHAIAQASLVVFRARVETAKLRLEYTKIRAPIAGIIQRPVETIGSLIKANVTPLADIVQGPTKTSATIRALQKERHAELVKGKTILLNQHKVGRVDLVQVIHSQRACLGAALDLCDTPEQRIGILREDLNLIENVVKHAQSRFDAGVKGSEAELAQLRAEVLAVRIRLLREEEMVTPQPPQ